MVGDWSPDPPREVEEQLTNSTQATFFESEDSEEDTFVNPPIGYELLFAPNTGLTSDEEEESDGTEAINNEDNNAEVDQNTDTDPSASSSTLPLDASENLAAHHRSETEEIASLYSSDSPRPDINVNCDEVRAAMSGFTLPPSSIPPWAMNIPEAQWATTLIQQIQRLITKDESKPTT